MRNGERPRSWGFWTEVKLDALAHYLPQFTTASRSARSTLYLDLFAGSVNNVRRDDEDRHFFGSTVRALETEPGFSTLRFFELDPNAAHLKKQLRERYPNDDRFRVIQGDCNKTIAGCLGDCWGLSEILCKRRGLRVRSGLLWAGEDHVCD
ncbi:MAG: three-Cys-motif partner protein TcmP [Acidimicrobiaceae bacterium]|nr:three-Cys-motif partner protein TcmP [Acidimicrobiaceae bacterium]